MPHGLDGDDSGRANQSPWRPIVVSPLSETHTWKRLSAGSRCRSSVIQARRTSMRRSPRTRGVFSLIRRIASQLMRNHTSLPSGSSSAPNQQALGFSGSGGRGVRIRVPPGQSSRRQPCVCRLQGTQALVSVPTLPRRDTIEPLPPHPASPCARPCRQSSPDFDHVSAHPRAAARRYHMTAFSSSGTAT